MNERNETQAEPLWRVLGSYAAKQLGRLQGGYLSGASWAKADLAQLRNIDPTRDDRLLMAWEATFADPPAEFVGRGDDPSTSERVLVSTMHLYAVHQQSKTEPMHVNGVGLGTAIRRLSNPADAESREKPVMRRYHALTTATELPEMLHHLRGLVSQMRAAGVALDYARLATDLFFLSHEKTRTRVRLAWARELVRSAKKNSEEDSGPATDN